MMARYLTITCFVAAISVFGNAEILVGPQDTEAESEKPVELHCKGTLADVEWQHLPPGAPYPELVYKDGFFYNGYKERFSASRTNDGRNVLIIREVRPSDAGTFTCLEDSETPSRRAAELIVFERFPSNESCAGKYTCKPICNALEMSCEMKAHGNHIPSMQWIDSEGRQLKSMEVTANEITISTLKLQADPYVAASFRCRLKYMEIPLVSKFGWTYSTSVTKEIESPINPSNQLDAVPPPQSVSMMTAIIGIVATFAVTVFIGIVIVLIYKRRQTKRKAKQRLGSPPSSIERSESSNEATQHFLSTQIELDENAVEEKFVPRTTVDSSGNAIYGVAAIDDEVFIMTKDGRVVEVFDLHKGTYRRHWSIGGLINPKDMAACPIEKRIFICDWKKAAEDKEIFCFDINGKQLGQSWVSECEDPQICIIDENNHLVTSLRKDPNIDYLSLSVPRTLAVDKYGNIYVSDQYNGRITVLNRALELKGFLDTTSNGHRVRGPMRICVHEYNNESWLLVADNVKENKKWRNGRLAVWNLQSCQLKSFPEA